MKIKHSNKPKTPLSQTDNLIRIAMCSKSMLIILLQLLPHLEKLFSRTLVLRSSIHCIYAFGVQVYNPKEELMVFHGSSLPSILLGDRNFIPHPSKYMLPWCWVPSPLQGAGDTQSRGHAPGMGSLQAGPTLAVTHVARQLTTNLIFPMD